MGAGWTLGRGLELIEAGVIRLRCTCQSKVAHDKVVDETPLWRSRMVMIIPGRSGWTGILVASLVKPKWPAWQAYTLHPKPGYGCKIVMISPSVLISDSKSMPLNFH